MPVARHAVPSEREYQPLGRLHLAEAAFESEHALRRMLDEAPLAARLHVVALDHQLVAAAPPLRDQLRLGHRAPDPLARRVEHALDADFTVALLGHFRLAHRSLPFVRARNSPSRSRRASSIRRYCVIHIASSSSRRGPRRHCRTRPIFSVVTRPASSRMATCFFIPVSVMPNRSASSVTDASPRPSRSRMPRRVGSESAPKASSSRDLY